MLYAVPWSYWGIVWSLLAAHVLLSFTLLNVVCVYAYASTQTRAHTHLQHTYIPYNTPSSDYLPAWVKVHQPISSIKRGGAGKGVVLLYTKICFFFGRNRDGLPLSFYNFYGSNLRVAHTDHFYGSLNFKGHRQKKFSEGIRFEDEFGSDFDWATDGSKCDAFDIVLFV